MYAHVCEHSVVYFEKKNTYDPTVRDMCMHMLKFKLVFLSRQHEGATYPIRRQAPVRPCSVANQSKGDGENWRGLKGILTCRGLNPLQYPPTLLVWGRNEQGLRDRVAGKRTISVLLILNHSPAW